LDLVAKTNAGKMSSRERIVKKATKFTNVNGVKKFQLA